ncbi:MAG: ATP-grasp domain-containing protein, partial [Planctomycetota bacterium]
LHGAWGEGGGLQHLLEMLEEETRGRIRFVGCGARASEIAMDKGASKERASESASAFGVTVLETKVVDASDERLPIDVPCVVKPIKEGSSIGLHFVETQEDADRALQAVKATDVVYMAEAMIRGREFTIAVMQTPAGFRAFPPVEIKSAVATYDYEAKYARDDTVYTPGSEMPSDAQQAMQDHACAVAESVGARHLARVDYLLAEDSEAVFLEINTMPGFTERSLYPMAAAHAGLDMDTLVLTLLNMANGS